MVTAVPVILIAEGRSGSTILQHALGQHPEIISSDKESPIVSRVVDLYSSYYEHPTKNVYYESCLPINREESLRLLKAFMLNNIFSDIISDHRYWLTKAFLNQDQATGLRKLCHGGKFIYLFRNGIDVVASRVLKNGGGLDKFESYCQQWASSEKAYDYLRRHENAIQVRYEDLISDVNDEFSRIFHFLKLKVSNQSTVFFSSNLIRSIVNTKDEINPQDYLDKRKPGHYDWDTKKKELFSRICGKAMINLGYRTPF